MKRNNLRVGVLGVTAFALLSLTGCGLSTSSASHRTTSASGPGVTTAPTQNPIPANGNPGGPMIPSSNQGTPAQGNPGGPMIPANNQGTPAQGNPGGTMVPAPAPAQTAPSSLVGTSPSTSQPGSGTKFTGSFGSTTSQSSPSVSSSTGATLSESGFASQLVPAVENLQTALSSTDTVTQNYINGNTTYAQFKSNYDADMQKASNDVQTIANLKAPADKVAFQEKYVSLLESGLKTLQLREDAFTANGGVDKAKLQQFATQFQSFMAQLQSMMTPSGSSVQSGQ